MTEEHHRRVRELFDRAIDLAPPERARLLDSECSGDLALRRELDDLISQDARTDSLRVPPVLERFRPSDGEEVIGPYRLVERLGEGGFGEVFVAEQTAPVRRRVALKILKAGMDTKSVLARFEAERQALALMDHPGIAKVFDAGETARGRPYFVMELVQGESITVYADRHRLPLRDRLELFIAVTNAVQHAHQKGIIHRDLKPSNVLVTLTDDKPAPKVIDFGIAKATSRSLTENTLYTERGLLLGTPEYMSPEQAEMDGLDVDTRADIYSLGIVLYELLTGSLPFERGTFRSGGIAQIQQVIREKEAPKPSTRVSGRGEAVAELAAKRQSDPARLARQLRGELDWIVLRAIEKDRARRYETANALGQDVRRYLSDEPVSAGPPSAAYRMKKFAKRHRVALGVGAVVLGSILFALVESNRQRVAAERARIDAEKARDESEAVTRFLANMLKAVNPREKGRDVSVREILDEGASTIDSKFPEQPLVRARLMQTMGNVYDELGHPREAEPLLEGALALREEALGPVNLDVAYSLNSLAIYRHRAGDNASAMALYERAIAIREKLQGPEHAEVGQVVSNLGNALWELGRYEDARAQYERALAIREKARGPDHPDVAQTLNNLGGLLSDLGDFDGARRCTERALAIREKALGPDHPDVAQTAYNLGFILYRSGRYAEARPHVERALASQERSLGPDHPEVALTLGMLGGLLAEGGDVPAARRQFEQALAIQERVFGPEHAMTAMSHINLGEMDARSGNYESARRHYERAIAIHAKVLEPGHADAAPAIGNLGNLHATMSDFAAARPLLEQALAIREKAFGPKHPEVIRNQRDLAGVLRALGRAGSADSLVALAATMEGAAADSAGAR